MILIAKSHYGYVTCLVCKYQDDGVCQQTCSKQNLLSLKGEGYPDLPGNPNLGFCSGSVQELVHKSVCAERGGGALWSVLGE